METVTLLPMMHRGAEQILICFDHHKRLNDTIRRLPAVKWSQTHKSWYLPLNEKNYRLIRHALSPLATINHDALHHYLVKRKAVKAAEVPKALSLPPPSTEKVQSVTANRPAIVTPEPTVAYRLSYENLMSLQKTVDLLMLKAYSHSTIRTYRGERRMFLQVLGKHPVVSLTTNDVKR